MSTQDQINQINTLITGFQGDIADTIQELAEYRASYFTPNLVSLPNISNFHNDQIAVTPADFGDLDNTAISATDPNKNPYQALTASILSAITYQKPTMDTGTAQAFVDQVEALTLGLFTEIETQLTNLLNSGGQNISPTIQAAVFDTGYERNLQTYNDALDLTGARTGAKGMRYANSMTKAMQAQITASYQYGLDDMSRKIVEVMANFANDTLKAAINAGISDNATKAQIFTETANALNRIQQTSLEEYKTDALTNFQIFESFLRIQMTDLEVQKADRDEMRAWIGEVRDQIRLASQVTVTEFEVQNKLQFLLADVQKYIADLQIKANEQAIEVFKANVQQFVELSRIAMQQLLENNKLQQDQLTQVASTYAELIKVLSVQGVSIQTSNS
jgi:hypothetical protein